jgi:hypothetical protein
MPEPGEHWLEPTDLRSSWLCVSLERRIGLPFAREQRKGMKWSLSDRNARSQFPTTKEKEKIDLLIMTGFKNKEISKKTW